MQMLTEQNKKYMGKRDDDAKAKAKAKVIHYFLPGTGWSWYVTEGEEESNGDWLFFGFVVGIEREWGSFRLSELTSVTGPMGLKIERDRWFDTPVTEFSTENV